jgi:hypothetical protein
MPGKHIRAATHVERVDEVHKDCKLLDKLLADMKKEFHSQEATLTYGQMTS